jgi:hypothetical protein
MLTQRSVFDIWSLSSHLWWICICKQISLLPQKYENNDLDMYLVDNECFLCSGSVYNNGLLCCNTGEYVDLTLQPFKCQKIGSSPCSLIRFNSTFKICCSSELYYNIETKACVAASGLNCDPTINICCSSGKKVQFSQG